MKRLMTAGTMLVDQQLGQLFSIVPQRAYYRFTPSLSDSKGDIDYIQNEYVKNLSQTAFTIYNSAEKRNRPYYAKYFT